MKDKFIQKTHKIRTASIDTDVISDLIAEFLGYSSATTKSSLEIFLILTAREIKIKLIGCPIVRKELKAAGLERFYNDVFDGDSAVNKNVRNLANLYVKETHVKSSDALIMASASICGIDIVLSRDRTHILKESVLDKIKQINNKRNVPIPIFISPSDLHERLYLGDKSLFINRTIIEKQFRLRTSFPK